MGLDTSHDCWHGSYGSFMSWRIAIAKAAGLPPLELMEGFFYENEVIGNPFYMTLNYGDKFEKGHIKSICKRLPIKWECLKKTPLLELLYHSDCDGIIKWKKCKGIADALEKITPLLPDEIVGGHNWIKERTERFINGLRLAYERKENVDFH